MIRNFTRFGRRVTIPSTVQVMHELRTFVLKKDAEAPLEAKVDAEK